MMVASLQIGEASATVESGLRFTVSGALASTEADLKGVDIVASFTRFVPSDGGAYTFILPRACKQYRAGTHSLYHQLISYLLLCNWMITFRQSFMACIHPSVTLLVS